jgi:hypothetical protein
MEELSTRNPAPELVRVEVYCGECGYDYALALEVDPSATTSSDLSAMIEQRLGDKRQTFCPRCDSLLVLSGGTVELETPERLRRAQAAAAQAESVAGLRFAVGSPDGARSTVWRLWLNDRRDDVYLAPRPIAGVLKLTLHVEPGVWRFAFTRQHVEAGSPFVPPGTDRAMDEWSPPQDFADGWQRAFVLIVPASEVVDPGSPYAAKGDVLWLPSPPDGELTEFTLLLSRPGASRGPRGFPAAEGHEAATEMITPLDLANGGRVWLMAHNASVSAGMRKQIDDHLAAVAEAGAREVIAAHAAASPTFDPRGYLFGNLDDGTRFLIDVSFASLLPE